MKIDLPLPRSRIMYLASARTAITESSVEIRKERLLNSMSEIRTTWDRILNGVCWQEWSTKLQLNASLGWAMAGFTPEVEGTPFMTISPKMVEIRHSVPEYSIATNVTAQTFMARSFAFFISTGKL